MVLSFKRWGLKKATLPQPILCLVGKEGDELADNGLKVVADLHLHCIFILVDGKNDCALECVNDLNALYRIGPKFQLDRVLISLVTFNKEK